MASNPYSELIEIIRGLVNEDISPSWRIGRVITVSPLIISVAGHNLSGKDLLCNEFLLNAEDERYRIKAGSSVVAMSSNDGQQYVIMCKVVGG